MRTAERSPVALALATCAYVAFIVYQSLMGGQPTSCGEVFLQQGGRLSVGDGLANFVAYLPLGVLAGAWGATHARAPVFVLAFVAISGLSMSMEVVQACLSHRVSSWYDWTMNSLGGLVGLLLSWVAGHGAGHRFATAHHAGTSDVHARHLHRSSLMWPLLLFMGAWLMATLSPWRFTLDVGAIRGNLSFLRHFAQWSGPNPWSLTHHLCAWLAMGFGLHAVLADWRKSTRWLAAVVAFSVIGQLLLARPVLSFERLLGMGFAFAAFAALAFRLPARLAAFAMPIACWLALAAYQLAPLPGRMATATFHLWPQLGRGGLLGALALALAYCWFGLSLVLALRSTRGAGRSTDAMPVVVGLCAGASMLVLELAQLWVPGRIADTSAPLITMLTFAVGWAVTGQPARMPGSTRIASSGRSA